MIPPSKILVFASLLYYHGWAETISETHDYYKPIACYVVSKHDGTKRIISINEVGCTCALRWIFAISLTSHSKEFVLDRASEVHCPTKSQGSYGLSAKTAEVAGRIRRNQCAIAFLWARLSHLHRRLLVRNSLLCC